MHSLSKPKYNFKDVFGICIKSRREPVKTLLSNQETYINQAIDNYERKMGESKGHQLQAIYSQNSNLFCELNKLYSEKMVNKSGPARYVYNEILVAGFSRRCCFCSCDGPDELDHFLPKSDFAEFAIAPINLIPICSRCNRAKSKALSKTNNTNFIHPYYEAYIENILWLGASVHFLSNGPSALFFVREDVDPTLKERFNFQIKILNLKKIYSDKASRELALRQRQWKKNYREGGAEQVKINLKTEYDVEKQNNKNYWRCALYRCLLESEEFCEMNWEL